MPNTYFFSDVHLGMKSSKLERVKERRLLSFLDHVASHGERLFIVGDLFEFWFEYRTVIPRGHMKVLSALVRLRELGLDVHYVAGNHDFWMRDFFSRELDITVHFEPLDITLDGKRFFLHHGDGIAANDGGYRLMKRIFRYPPNITLYSLIHPDLGIPLAKWVSNLSRNHSQHGGPPNDRDYRAMAKARFGEGFDYAIFGHIHYPNIQEYGPKTYVSLGDWIDHFTYALFDGEQIQLLYWK